MNKNRIKINFSLVGTIMCWLIGVICILVIAITVIAKKDSDDTATMFGYQLRFVQSASMEKSDQTDVSDYKIKDIPIKSCIFVKVVPTDDTEKAEWYSTLAVGDVITFKYTYARQETITHRIVQITQNPTGGFIIEFAGDNRSAENGTLTQTIDTSDTESTNYIIGKVTGQNYGLGLLIYAIKSPVGIACIIILPCLIIIAMQVIKIVGIFKKDKHRLLQEEQDKNMLEIEQLKNMIISLQNGQPITTIAQADITSNQPDNVIADDNNVKSIKNEGKEE